MNTLQRCIPLWLATAAMAQTTWIVDKLNGPGTNFLDIPEAVAAASDGDRIYIRYAGSSISSYYSAATVDAKGLTFLGDVINKPWVLGTWNVTNLSPTQSVVFTNLNLGGRTTTFISAGNTFLATNNRGVIVFDNMLVGFFIPFGGPTFTDCDLVVITHSDIWDQTDRPLRFTRSRVVVMDSSIRAFIGPIGGAGGAIHVTSGTAWLMNSFIEGQWGDAQFPNSQQPGMSVTGAEVFVCTGTTIRGGQPYGGGLRRIAIYDAGGVPHVPSLVHWDFTDATIVLDRPPQMNTINGAVPALHFTLGPASIHFTQKSIPTSLTLLAAGPIGTTPWPTIAGPSFVDPANLVLSDIRIAPATGLVPRSYYIPPGLPPGLRLGFQGFELSGTNRLFTTNPTVFGLW